MFTFSEAECIYLKEEIRMDGQGRPTLVGLAFEETAEFWAMVRMLAAGGQLAPDQVEQYQALSRKLTAALDQGRKS